MRPPYLVIKTINGNRYYYWQKTHRVGKQVKTWNKYVGPVGKVPRPTGQPTLTPRDKYEQARLAHRASAPFKSALEAIQSPTYKAMKQAQEALRTPTLAQPIASQEPSSTVLSPATEFHNNDYVRVFCKGVHIKNPDGTIIHDKTHQAFTGVYRSEDYAPHHWIELPDGSKILNDGMWTLTHKATHRSFTYAPIQPSVGLSPADAAIEQKAITKLQANRKGMLDEYTRNFGKVVNADLARRLFADVGYNGRNSAAVHEPSSALAKDAWRHNLKTNGQPDAVLYAGMSGAGKSSAVTGVLPHIEDDAAAVLDGNLSKITTAEERIKEALDAGKDPIIVYVWRDPVDAWVNGVVKRMKSNAEEGGRVVPMSEALKNGPGSLATVRAALEKGAAYNEDVYIVDNSLGPKNAKLMDREKFDRLSYPENLRDTLLEKTTELYHDGQITREQYEALIA